MNRRFRLHHLYIQERAGTSTYIDTRTVFLSKYLKKGNYVLVPTMFQHGRTSEFLLRIFSEVPVQLRFSFIVMLCKPLLSFPPSLIFSLIFLYAYSQGDNILKFDLTNWNKKWSKYFSEQSYGKFSNADLRFRVLIRDLRGRDLSLVIYLHLSGWFYIFWVAGLLCLVLSAG